jgi:hypothetical protein
MQDDTEVERNRAWYDANRKTLVRGKWYVIDGGALALGPFDTEHAMGMFFEHVEKCSFGEHAYYVRAGNKNPDSMDETFVRCTKQLLALYRCGQHRKMMFLDDTLGAMLDEMGDHSVHDHKGTQKDRDWSPPTSDSKPFSAAKLSECQLALQLMRTGAERSVATYDDMQSDYKRITKAYNRAAEENSAFLREIAQIYAEAALLMRQAWAETPRDVQIYAAKCWNY